MNKFPLSLAALAAALTLASQGQVLIDDNMEGYPTATSTSVFPHVANPDPAYWESVVGAESGSATATAGVGALNGNPGRAAVMNANFSAAGGWAYSILK